ncbi:sugar phosphate isomerase/epimerase [uncultured Erythrobacter sp.]|uniref:sugar phosphate isomerase/epimerase family protein n=1 Tax=uncultured Erythrobacter sp. TaxID=263913 RepID=UPI00262DDC58|nr:sugar phosphate isomerase/epimerase family protein [uncultured Erythrobacter sp.]
MKLAMSNIAWAPEERLAAYQAMAEIGFTGLEIAPGLFFHQSDNPLVPCDVRAGEALSEMAGYGLELVSMQSLLFGVQGTGLFEGDDARAALVKGMHRAIDLAGRFGIPNLVFGSPAQRRIPDGMSMERALGKATEVFRALGDRAKSAGTRITIEANPAAYGTNFLNTLDEVEVFVAEVNHPAIAVILDLGAMHMNGEFDTVPERLRTISQTLNHVHVSEPELAPAPADPTLLAPVLSALDKHSYDKAVSIEMRRPENGIQGIKSSIVALATAAKTAGIGWGMAHA